MDDRLRTAYHEAGHAVCDYLLDIPYSSISMIPDATSIARVVLRNPPPLDLYHVSRDELYRWCAVCVAGAVAEELLLGTARAPSGLDYSWANRFALALGGGNQNVANIQLYSVYRMTKWLLLRPDVWAATQALAKHVYVKDVIDVSTANAVILGAMRKTPVLDVIVSARKGKPSSWVPFSYSKAWTPGAEVWVELCCSLVDKVGELICAVIAAIIFFSAVYMCVIIAEYLMPIAVLIFIAVSIVVLVVATLLGTYRYLADVINHRLGGSSHQESPRG